MTALTPRDKDESESAVAELERARVDAQLDELNVAQKRRHLELERTHFELQELINRHRDEQAEREHRRELATNERLELAQTKEEASPSGNYSYERYTYDREVIARLTILTSFIPTLLGLIAFIIEIVRSSNSTYSPNTVAYVVGGILALSTPAACVAASLAAQRRERYEAAVRKTEALDAQLAVMESRLQAFERRLTGP